MATTNPNLQPYGLWYTSPGGLRYHADDAIASAIERARAKLKKLRDWSITEPAIHFGRQAALQFAGAAAQLVPALLSITAYYMQSAQERRFQPLMLVLALNFVLLTGNGIRMLVYPPSRNPEAMFRYYLAHCIGLGRGWARRLLPEAELGAAFPRNVPAYMGGADALGTGFDFSSTYSFGRYWAHAFGGGWRLFRNVRFKDMRAAEIAPDLVLVDATVKVTARRMWLLLLAQVPMLVSLIGALIVVMILIALDAMPDDKVVVAAVFGLILGVALLLTLAMTVRAMIPVATRHLMVRKLVVHVNGQWRIFNGELQGAEESDVSWLLEG